METLERTIAEHPFFADLAPRYTDLVVGCASNVRFRSGEYIFKEGGEASEFYLIRAGNVALEIFAPQHKPIMVETLGEGDILGWSWLVPPYKRRFHAHALDDTRAIALNGKCLRTKCDENHDLGYELLKRVTEILSERLEVTRFRLLDVYAAR